MPTQEQKYACNAITSAFIKFRRSIINTWRNYNYLDYSTLELKKVCESTRAVVNITIENLYNQGTKTFYSNSEF